MSLQSRLADLVAAVGADVKSLTARMNGFLTDAFDPPVDTTGLWVPRYVSRKNLQPNPKLGASGTGWSASLGTGVTDLGCGRALIPDGSGDYGYRIYGQHAANTTNVALHATRAIREIPVVAGHTYTVSADLYTVDTASGAPTGTARGIRLQIYWYDAGGTQLSITTSAAPYTDDIANTRQRISLSAAAPASAVSASIRAGWTSDVSGDIVDGYVTRVLFEEYATARSYIDGDMYGYRWDGAANESTSQSVKHRPSLYTYDPDTLAWTEIGSQAPKLVSVLPSSPADDEEVYFQTADMVAAGISPWHLRYRAASTSAYKWEMLGGNFWSAAGAGITGLALLANTQTTYAGAARIVVPLAGDYMVQATATVAMTSGASGATVEESRLHVNNEIGASVDMGMGVCFTNAGVPLSGFSRWNALVAGTNLVNYFANSLAGNMNVRYDRLAVRPIRVG